MNNNLDILLGRFLKKNNIKINSNDLKFQLQSNIDYPSISSISDTLDFFEIENLVVKIPLDSIDELPKSFITKTKDEKVVLVIRKGSKFKIQYDDSSKELITKEMFLTIWSGVVVLIDSNKKSFIERFKIDFIFVVLALGSLFFLNYILFSIESAMALFYSALGLLVSYFVFKTNNKEKKCAFSSFNKKKEGCETIVTKEDFQLFKIFELSDLVIIYFSFLFLSNLFFGYNNLIIFFSGLLSIPFIFFSLYLQIIKKKAYCLYCMLIILLLILQITYSVFNFQGFHFSLSLLYNSLLLTIIIVLFWLEYKQNYIRNKENFDKLTKHTKFFNNPNLFLKLLHQNPILDKFSNESIISFGTTNNPILHIVAITNPFCKYCSDSIMVYDSVLKKYPEKVRLDFVFLVPDDKEKQSTQMAVKIQELYNVSPQSAYDAILNWYKNKNIEMWNTEYGNPSFLNNSFECIQKQSEYATENNISYTPATIINNYLYPEVYTINDFEQLAAGVISQLENKQT